MSHTLWGGRFSESPDELAQTFNASVFFDYQLAPYDIQGSIAHANMLHKIGVLSKQELDSIVQGLTDIADTIAQNKMDWSVALEDVHMNIEALLTKNIGDVGKKLHTARSRNDQVATDLRLYTRAKIEEICQLIMQLQTVLLDLAERETDTIMPGFTHLQTAQPVTFGHHMMAWYMMIQRDFSRFEDCLKRVNFCPLGSAALAGTTFPIDRDYTAKALGFTAPTANSLDAVSDRDFVIETIHACSLLSMHLSRWSEELIIWSSSQFNFIQLSDQFCTGSSIMPQKKNPDMAELARGKTGRIYGHLISVLTLMKGQPLAYNKDNQEDKEPLFDTVDTICLTLRVFIEMLPGLKTHKENMYQAAQKGFATATDLADYLVRKGIAFRDAHEIVGKAVKQAIDNDCGLEDLSLDALQKFSNTIDADVFDILTLEGSVAARNHLGGTAPSQIREQIAKARAYLQSVAKSR